ncbi:hypothetical protein [Spiroplasma endosymbiont of Dilophus febrilis]
MLFFQNYSNLYPPNKTLCALSISRNSIIKVLLWRNIKSFGK